MPHTPTPPSRRPPVALLLIPPDTTGRHRAGWGGLPTQHLALLIRRHSRLGDLVVSLDNDPTIAAVAAHLHRIPSHLRPSQPRPCHRVDPVLPSRRRAHGVGLVLVPPSLWRRLGGQTAAIDALNSCRGLLRPGGYLITTLPVRGPGLHSASLRTDVIAAARAAGLVYHQHIPAIAAPDPATEADPESPRRLVAGRHQRAHRDVLVFAATTLEATP